MSGWMYFIIAVAAFCLLYFMIPMAIGAYMKFRGRRLVTCPETGRPAAVEVDAGRAAITSAFLGKPELRLSSCSRWPERQNCGQECLVQIELAPEECLIRGLLTHWYEGKACVFCGSSFGEIHWFDHKPALLSPEGKIVEWHQLNPEVLDEVFATHKPVCWNCGIAESFRREHAELVVDRSWGAGSGSGPRANA